MTQDSNSSSSLKSKITEDMKASMKSGDKERLAAVRLILAAIQEKEVALREQLKDEQIIEVLQKLAKKIKESIFQYKDANRDDLVKQEEFELSVVSEYLPDNMSEEEVTKLIDKIFQEKSIENMSQMGDAMKELKQLSGGRVDMALASKLVKGKLS
tara:strand:+ start:931 stop:1398 length:468 start_codon:yes stop_codon:yes gene_type:complete